MNTYFSTFRTLLATSVLLVVLSLGCSDNYDITKVTPEAYAADYRTDWGYLPSMINSINEITSSWQFQVQEYLNAGMFSQMYMTAAGGTYCAQPNNTQLSMTDGWNSWAAQVPYSTVMPGWLEIKKAFKDNSPFIAIATIVKVAAMHKVVDAFGPAQYINYGTSSSGVAYDPVDSIYYKMIAELTESNQILDTYMKNTNETTVEVLTEEEVIYKGDLEKWRKLANSFKLRLAMRMAMKDKDKAKVYVNEAISAGVILENADNAYIQIGGNTNPYYTYAYSWGEMRMSALAESILVGYNDPRLPKIYTQSKQVANTYKGIRLGATPAGVGGYGDFSIFVVKKTTPMRLFSAAETQFLLAEAALRGFITSGTAQSYYEEGIAKSLAEYGVSAPTYKSSTSKPIDYVDPINSAKNNTPASTDITVSWSDATSDDQRLEKIITQKWIALIPNGAEGWAEYRRTGYPKVFKASTNLQSDVIDSTGPRRLPYTAYHQSNSADKTALQTAINNSFGGKDLPNQRLWWDIADKSFKK